MKEAALSLMTPIAVATLAGAVETSDQQAMKLASRRSAE